MRLQFTTGDFFFSLGIFFGTAIAVGLTLLTIVFTTIKLLS